MRFIYADPGLSNEVGHHANSCRVIAGELRRRGMEPEVLAFGGVEEDLQKEFGAKPFFHCHTYWNDRDPICGWLNTFHHIFEYTLRDLSELSAMTNADIVYLNSAIAAQLVAVATWLTTLEAENRPHVILEFGMDAGIDQVSGPNGRILLPRDPRVDPRGTLNRFAARYITKETSPFLHLVTFDKDSSAVYAELTGHPVGVLPLPQSRNRPLRRRGANEVITVAVLGHQRADKGYQHVPEIAELLLKTHVGIRLLVHNSRPEEMIQVQEVMRRLAAADARIVLDERVVRGEEWSQLLEAADLMLCPYDAACFRAGYSAVAAEAIANAIPMVVPADSTLARTLNEIGGGGTAFEQFNPQSIARAVGRTLDGFEEFANKALAGAEMWARAHGPVHTVDAILRMGMQGVSRQ